MLGPELATFERRAAELLGVGHAVGVSSGTDALLVALMAHDIGPGDEVLCPALSFFATAEGVARLGATPVFVDVELDDFCSSAARFEARLTERTKAALPVHLFGQCVDVRSLTKVLEPQRVSVIEDAAQAIGAAVDGAKAGSMGVVGCFSFFPTKNLGAIGDGGLVTTSNDALAERIRRLRVHGAASKDVHFEVGGNFRLDEVQAALLAVKLSRLAQVTTRRQQHAAAYTTALIDAGVAVPNEGQRSADAPLLVPTILRGEHVFNQYVVRVLQGRRDALREYLTARGIGTATYYPVPLHLQEAFKHVRQGIGSCPNAEHLCGEVLALPVYSELTDDERSQVIDGVVSFFRN